MPVSMPKPSADTPDMLEIALDKPEYRSGDTMTVAVTASNAGRLTLNVVGDRMLATQCATCSTGVTQLKLPVGSDWGTGAYVVATLRRPLDAPAQRMPGARHRRAMVLGRPHGTHANVEIKPPALIRPNSTLHIPVKVTGSRPAKRRAWSSPRSMSASSISPTTSRRRPMTIFSANEGSRAEIRDLYGELIDGMQGARGADPHRRRRTAARA